MHEPQAFLHRMTLLDPCLNVFKPRSICSDKGFPRIWNIINLRQRPFEVLLARRSKIGELADQAGALLENAGHLRCHCRPSSCTHRDLGKPDVLTRDFFPSLDQLLRSVEGCCQGEDLSVVFDWVKQCWRNELAGIGDVDQGGIVSRESTSAPSQGRPSRSVGGVHQLLSVRIWRGKPSQDRRMTILGLNMVWKFCM